MNYESISKSSISNIIDYSKNKQTENNNIFKNDNYKHLKLFFKNEQKPFYKIIFVKTLAGKKDLNVIYDKIYKLGYSRVLVETGLTFLNFLLSNKALNELYIFKSENKLGKNGNNNDTSKYIKKIFSKLPLINIHNDQLVKKRFNNV